MTEIYIHPFKRGIRQLLGQHFHDSIANRFELILEAERYNDNSEHVWKQKRDNMMILEVYYRQPSGLTEYICDLFSWMTKKQCEFKLLTYITDKAKAGLIGRDWLAKDGRFSEDIKSAKFETPEEEITKYMAHNARKEGNEVQRSRRTGTKRTA